MNSPPELETLRSEIDAIDDELIALLKKRIDVVSQVGQHKRAAGEKGIFIRSGREGQMHQRIYDAFAGSNYPPEAMVAIWRLLIAASTHHESPLQLAILHTPDEPDTATLAREYFGNFLERRLYSSASTLLADLHDGKANIGVLPYPRNEVHWWHQMAQYQQARCHIFARLPVMATRPQESSALAIAALTPEPSGDDVSYYVLSTDETSSTSRLHTLFHKAGLKAEFIDALSDSHGRSLLVRLDGFYTQDHGAIAELTQLLDQPDLRFLGAHPKAIEA